MRADWAMLLAGLWASGAWAQQEPVLDLARLPPMKDPGAALYRDRFLIGNLPRAWAVASDGSFGGASGMPSRQAARDSALKNCAAKGASDCALYAEGLDVVWQRRAVPARTVPEALLSGRGYAFVPDARYFWHGPQAAKGVVVWGHGYGGPADDERGLQPPAFLRPLNNAGFDMVRFDRDPGWDHDVDRVVGWHREGLVALRRMGWRVIVAGGQSRGGWNALEMLRTPGVADAIVTTSAGPGTGTDAGMQILRGQTMLYALASDVPPQSTRLVYIQLKDDAYESDEARRARRVREMIGPRIGALLLIDQPDGITGHMGAYNATFAIRFADCITRFVTAPSPRSEC